MKKLLLAVLSAVCAVSLTVAATACTKVQPSTKFEAPDQPEQKSQELGSDFSFPSLAGKYGETTVTPVITVTYGGNSVETEKDGFRLDKVGEYTITYTFTYGDGETYTMTQKVISVDGVAPTVVIGELQGKYKYGDTVEIPEIQVVDLSGEEIQATVSVHLGSQDSSETVTVENGSFKVESYEQHYIVAEATDSSGNKGTGVASFAVQQEGEIEFFNSKSYTLKNYVTDNALLDFNTDAKYIFEGEGSAHVTNTSTGIYPGFILRNTYGTEYKDAVSAVMWVYNNSAKDVNINVVTCEGKEDGGIREVETIASFTAPAGMWSKMELNAEELAKIGEKQFLKLFMHKEINPEMYNQLDVYFDAFKVYTADTLPAYSLNPDKITANCEGKESISVLSVEQITGITDINNVSAMLVNLETGAKTQLVATEQGISIPAQKGAYKVYYVYKNGTDGVTAEQDVILYDNASQYLYQKTYGIENFEDKLELSANDYYPMVAGNAVYTKHEEGGEHGTVLKITNNVNSAWTVSQLKPSSAFQLNDGDTLKFDFKLDKPAGALNYCLRIYTLGKEENIQSGKDFWLQDVTNFGEWNTITLTGETAASVAANGGFGIYIIVNKEGGGNCLDYVAYVDNIRVEKTDIVSDGSQTLSELLTDKFTADTEMSLVSVTDSKGNPYELEGDKFTDTDVYTVCIKAETEGLNAAEYQISVNVKLYDISKKVYGIEDFDSTADISASEYYPAAAENATYAKYVEGGAHGNVLKITNNPNSAFTFSQLKPFVVSQMTANDTLKFDFKLDKPAGALNYCLRIFKLGKEEDIQSGKPFWLQDATNFGEWTTVTLTGEAVQNIVADGGFALYIIVNKDGGGNCYDYIAYVDNIRIEKAVQTANGSNTLQAMVNELFVGADEVIVKKVTDAEGTEVILSEGKFTQDGTYTVEVLVKADGLNENTFTLTYNVTI